MKPVPRRPCVRPAHYPSRPAIDLGHAGNIRCDPHVATVCDHAFGTAIYPNRANRSQFTSWFLNEIIPPFVSQRWLPCAATQAAKMLSNHPHGYAPVSASLIVLSLITHKR